MTRGLSAIEERLDALKRRLDARWGEDEPLHVLPFRGYGTRERLWLRGRVLQAESVPEMREDPSLLDNLRDMLERYETDEVPGAQVRVTFGDRVWTVESDAEAYFTVDIPDPERVESPWTPVELELLEPTVEGQGPVRSTGYVRVPAETARLGVISDMDDTVIKTGVTNALQSVRTIMSNDARSREPFAGIAPFYQALVEGPEGGAGNPVFYVSSSPWNIYDLFESFMEVHDIPLGPILLKDFGLEPGKLLKSGHVEYKAQRIQRIIDTYPDIRFILLGDSGQKDAWVFRTVVERNPGRIATAYLRDLAPDDPDPEIEAIEQALAAGGVTMMRVPDTADAAAHACEQGWISEAQRDEVRRAVDDQSGNP